MYDELLDANIEYDIISGESVDDIETLPVTEDQASEGSLVDDSFIVSEDGSEEEENLAEVTEDPSSEQIIELLKEINENVKGLKEDENGRAEPLQDSAVRGSDDPVVLRNMETVSVSENILTKPINDYTVSESFLFFISLAVLVSGVVILIKKGLPRWR